MGVDQRALNNVYAGAIFTSSREADLDAFDMLPPALRWVVNENATKLAAYTVLRHAHNLVAAGIPPANAISATIREILKLEAGEISVFAGRYKGQFGQELPHAAARASVQRYGASRRGGSRLPRRS
jgi:hypothetical protein